VGKEAVEAIRLACPILHSPSSRRLPSACR
jgi:hypothetical protein